MFVTKECDYGIRIIRALADGTKKTAKTIAEEECIPPRFASKIIKKLEQAAYVRSYRGSSGGYHLTRPLSTITLADLITAIDNHRYVNECVCNGSSCIFKSHSDRPCTVHKEFARAQEVMVSTLSTKTMDALFYGA